MSKQEGKTERDINFRAMMARIALSVQDMPWAGCEGRGCILNA